jgi:hypothetical protein
MICEPISGRQLVDRREMMGLYVAAHLGQIPRIVVYRFGLTKVNNKSSVVTENQVPGMD